MNCLYCKSKLKSNPNNPYLHLRCKSNNHEFFIHDNGYELLLNYNAKYRNYTYDLLVYNNNVVIEKYNKHRSFHQRLTLDQFPIHDYIESNQLMQKLNTLINFQ